MYNVRSFEFNTSTNHLAVRNELFDDVVLAAKILVERGYTTELVSDVGFVLHKNVVRKVDNDVYNTNIVIFVILEFSELDTEEHYQILELHNVLSTGKLTKAVSATGVTSDSMIRYLSEEELSEEVDLSNPHWNQSAGGHTWSLVSQIVNGNDSYTKDDAIFISYLMKHIVRAGSKPYENHSDEQAKIIDLKKAQTYLTAWIELLEEEISND